MQRDTRILIVDDAQLQRLVYVRSFQAAGYTHVSQACNGLEAVLHVQENRPDIVVMDLMMDLMDGVSAIKYLKAIDPGITVIVHSEAVSIAAFEPYAQHAFAFFQKSGDLEEQGKRLVDTVGRVPLTTWRDLPRYRVDQAILSAVDEFNSEFDSLVSNFGARVKQELRRELHCQSDIDDLLHGLFQKLGQEGIHLVPELPEDPQVEAPSVATELSLVVDEIYFRELTESVGGPGPAGQLIRRFESRAEQVLELLKRWAGEPKPDREGDATRLAHDVAGVCASLGAIRARESAMSLYHAAVNHAEASVIESRCLKLVERIREAHAKLVLLLDAHGELTPRSYAGTSLDF